MIQTFTPKSLRSATLSFFFFHLFFLSGFSQTNLLNPPGTNYLETGGVVLDNYGPADISNCTSLIFTFDWAFSQAWSGGADMESADECGACAGDPGDPAAPDCNNCWDFLQIEYLVDGAVVATQLIGGAGTTDADQTGSFRHVECVDPASNANASIRVQSQTWDNGESVTYSNISIVCYEGAPRATANPDPLCSTEVLSLDGDVDDFGVLDRVRWSGPGTIDDPSQIRTTATGMPPPSATYTFTVTDLNGCSASTDVTVSVNSVDANPPSSALIVCIDQAAGDSEVLNEDEIRDQITGGDPNLTVNFWFDAAATDPLDPNDPNDVRRLAITMQTVVFATVNDGTCESATVAVFIDAQENPEPQNETLTACRDETGSA
ncbi:MAG: hypothetical protein D6772_13350, partial [Bacteroidetes bacterium]